VSASPARARSTGLRFSGLATAAVAFQCLAGPWYELGGVRPHFVALVVAAASLDGSRGAPWGAALLAGSLLDLLSIDPFGAHLVSLLVLVVAVRGGLAAGLGGAPLARGLAVAAGLAAAAAARPLFVWLVAPEAAGALAPHLRLAPFVLGWTLVFAWPVLGALRPARRARGAFLGGAARWFATA
jgi:rod shape-determining protein MreD